MRFEILCSFLTVVQQGSISAAARKLHIAQPALCKQMQQLEEELSDTLLIRESRKIILTESGKTLCKRTELLKQLKNSLRSEMTELSHSLNYAHR
ncbi:MAG: LysR family transcriptional regulator [Clostridiales bacterium]|nr:LysR family transcriptional regulator [Clostridiales bacterium]